MISGDYEPVDLLAALQGSVTRAKDARHSKVATATTVVASDKDYYREQAEFIETLAGHLANGRIAHGQRHASTRQLLQAVQALVAWQEDDRS